jgi:hypothetical protein
MNLNQIPAAYIVFALTQTVLAFWAIVKMYFKLNSLDDKVNKLEKENEQLKHELKEMRDIMIKVEQNTTLLMMGRIKTRSMEH